ncbi:MAG TPA: hypothetical protein VND94_17470 [Terriglobia bacterium]|nr:hypothetical protein [Terriglobia bacterium]
MTPKFQPILLDETAAAEFLGLPKSTVRAERLRCSIDHVRVERRIYYTLQQLIQYVESRTVRSSGEHLRPATERSATAASEQSREDVGSAIKAIASRTVRKSDRDAAAALARETFARQPRQVGRGSSRKKSP